MIAGRERRASRRKQIVGDPRAIRCIDHNFAKSVRLVFGRASRAWGILLVSNRRFDQYHRSHHRPNLYSQNSASLLRQELPFSGEYERLYLGS